MRLGLGLGARVGGPRSLGCGAAEFGVCDPCRAPVCFLSVISSRADQLQN